MQEAERSRTIQGCYDDRRQRPDSESDCRKSWCGPCIISEVLPEDKANFIEAEKKAGRKVIMIGDGINDSPALSAADVGIAISDGAEIAREIADVTVGADSLHEIVTPKELSDRLMSRIHGNYRSIVGINTGLILLGVMGVIPPTTSALLHNSSTLYISLKSMKNLLPE